MPGDSGSLRTEFMRVASHELRTPLTSIRGYSELLASGRAGPLSEQQQRMVTLIDLCAGQLHGIVEDLIVLAGLDDGSFGLALEPTRLAPLVGRVAGELGTHARAAGVTLAVDVPGEAVLVADPRHLHRALSSLLATAVTFAPKHGTVTVRGRLETDGGAGVLVGCPAGGVGAEEQLAVYERGLGPGPAQLEGVGLALAVVRAVVQRHGGTVETSAGDEGVTVIVGLPSAPPADPAHVLLDRRTTV